MTQEQSTAVASTAFSAFSLAPALLQNLINAGYETPTPIQAAAIPALLDKRDLIGIAQTGTGKTAAFALPLLHYHVTQPKRPAPRNARMIVLSPTRELAVQIADTFHQLGKGLKFSLATIFGGVSERGQIQTAARGIDILVATPGRLIDLIERRFLTLEGTEIFVLDEADRMLDMGFIRDVRLLTKRLPKARQSLMFSATMPPAIREIAEEMLTDPVKVAVTPKVVTVEKIQQGVYFVGQKQKPRLLLELLNDAALSSVVVFTRTKHGANRVTQYLEKNGIMAGVIHGNKSQNARQAALNAFRQGEARVLVATDIASRGIDVPGISHVINYELPDEPESYVHRIGRTARAGREGEAIAFCDPSERSQLRQIERLTKVQLQVLTHTAVTSTEHGALNAAREELEPESQRETRPQRRPQGGAPRGDSARGDGQRSSRGPRPDLRNKRFAERRERGDGFDRRGDQRSSGGVRGESRADRGREGFEGNTPQRPAPRPAHGNAAEASRDVRPSAGHDGANQHRSAPRFDDHRGRRDWRDRADRGGYRGGGGDRPQASARTDDRGGRADAAARDHRRPDAPRAPAAPRAHGDDIRRLEPRRDDRQGHGGLRRQRSQ